MNSRKGLPLKNFKDGDTAMLANPYLVVVNDDKWGDTFTIKERVCPTNGTFLAAVNNRTGRSYVMGDGDYSLWEGGK